MLIFFFSYFILHVLMLSMFDYSAFSCVLWFRYGCRVRGNRVNQPNLFTAEASMEN
jgi:hypothetical protein